MKAGTLSDSTIVGRDKELEALQALLHSATEGKGKTVFVSGEAGSGKTKLANEFISAAKQKNEVKILTGLCLSNAAAPYVPFLEAFNSYFAQERSQLTKDDAAEVKAWLTGARAGHTGKYGNLTPQTWKDMAFAAVTKTLFLISACTPVILFIEDIHWADSASLSLLHFMARALRSEKVLLLATFRSEELTTDAEGFMHPLAEELRQMQREDLFIEIKLSNLNQTDVLEIAENMIGGAVSAELASKLADESRGNALFIVESLRMLNERGSLFKEKDEWHLAIDVLDVPKKLKDIILSRLGGLRFNQRRVLDAASIIGEKFDVELLSTVLGQDSLEVLETLNMIAQSTSLVSVEEDFFRFDHAKSREAIYGEIPRPLKKGYHTRVAEKLESRRVDGGLPFAEISYHYAQAGNKEKAVKNAIAAGQNALARFSNVEAIKHLSYVLETLPDSPENAESKRDALEGLGDAYYANCMYKEALTVFERLAIFETGKARLRAYRKALDAIFFGRGDPTYFMELAKRAEPYAAFDRLESARIRFHKASYLSRAESEIEWEAALRVFEEEYSLLDVARTLSALGIIKVLIHPDEQGLAAILRSDKMSEEFGDLHSVMLSSTWAGIAFYGLGFSAEASGILTRAVRLGERIGDYNQLAMIDAYLGQVQERLGLFEEAVSTSLKALEYSQKSSGGPSDLILANLVRLHARLGNSEAAEENYWNLMKSPPKPGPADNINLTREFYIARAQTAFFVLKNRWDEAKQSLNKAFEISKKIMNVVMLARDDYAWVLEKQGRMEEAKVQLGENQKVAAEIEKKFARVNVQASLIVPWKVVAGEEFEIRLDIVNVSKKPGLLVKAEYLIPPGFKVTTQPAFYSLENGYIDLKKRSIDPFRVETIKLRLKTSNTGTFDLSPQITYIDESVEARICKPKSVSITVQPAKLQFEILPGRVSTGFGELDAILFGGIPEKYAVALTAPTIDERDLLIRRFLEAGAKEGDPTFSVTTEPENVKTLAKEYPENFLLFVCSPQADTMIKTAPNVFELKGVENLTDIDIALTKAFRTLNPSATSPKRICIDIISDILLQHHAVTTRRWLSALLTNLKSKGFTVLAVIDPQMHPPEEVQAILSLFDGEIRIKEKETPQGFRQMLRVKRLNNQKYLENELTLTKEKTGTIAAPPRLQHRLNRLSTRRTTTVNFRKTHDRFSFTHIRKYRFRSNCSPNKLP